MTSIYYISWRTWHENEVTTPWQWYSLQQGTTYKKRKNSTSNLIVDAELMAQAFQTQNQQILDEIDQNFINDVVLASFLEDNSEQAAAEQVLKQFPDAEILRCQEVDLATKQQILELFDQAIRRQELGK